MDLMTWLNRLDKTKRENFFHILDEIASRSAVHHQFTQNIFADHQLGEQDWDSFFSLLSNSSTSTRDLEQKIRFFCQDRTLRGRPSSKNSAQIIYGRIVPLEVFCDILVKEGFYVELAIDRSTDSLPSHWSKYPLGKFLMWSTFGDDQPKPFGEPEPPGAEIQCVLGIPPIRNGGPLILLEYKIPHSVKAYAPTVCDAYAGAFWSRYFRPPQRGNDHGRTMPTDNCPIQRGKPEVVHEVITAAYLDQPLRYAK